MADGFKLEPKHADDCRAWNDPDGVVFVVTDDKAPFARLDRAGRRPGRGSGMKWHRFCCQDPYCPARMLVRWDVIAWFISQGAAPDFDRAARARKGR